MRWLDGITDSTLELFQILKDDAVKVLVTQLCPTLCNPTDCSPPGFSVNGIFQARILQWIAYSFSRDLPNPGIEPASPALTGGFFTTEPPVVGK